MQIRPLYMHRYGGVYADLDSQAGHLIYGLDTGQPTARLVPKLCVAAPIKGSAFRCQVRLKYCTCRQCNLWQVSCGASG